MGDVWTAVALLIKFFNNYAGKGGNPNTINKSELKALLQDQFGVELKVSDLQPHFSILPNRDAPWLTVHWNGMTCNKHFSSLQGRNDPAVDDYFNTLDTNGDGELDFSEFMQYVANFAVLAKEFPTSEGS